MRWASGESTAADVDAAVREAAATVAAGLAGARPDLAFVFVSVAYGDGLTRVPALVHAALDPVHLVGCTAGGVIGGGREIEGRAAVAVVAAALPDVQVRPFGLEPAALTGARAPGSAWTEGLGLHAGTAPALVLLPDPFSCDTEVVLHALDRALPAATIVGGLASGGGTPGAHALYCGRTVQRAGLVGVALSGNVAVDTVVAQGCRPIGEPLFVTRADGQVISELDGRRPLEVLQGLAEAADARDRRLFGHSLFVGIVMRAHQGAYRQGDFLIRNIIGLDGERGAIAIGASVEPGAVVQFHLRDADTSAADLTTLLERQAAGARPAGALLFSCLGRGASLYGRADHDSEAVRRHLGDVPLGGFFCNGEIGPVQGATFVHGYTSALGLFRAPRG